MITDPKVRKFVDFYLSELLTHVKSMSEHRFTPQEYNLVKKVIVFITQSGDHLSQVEKLSSVSALSAFYAFLQKIVEKVQQPDFKKSQMISVIETDSEKLSQILSQIVKTRGQLAGMESELAKIGLDVDTEPLRKEPAKVEVQPPEKIQKPVPEEKKTPVVTKESTPAAKPQILTASEFKKVDDMIGFLSKRRKKPSHVKDEPDVVEKASDPTTSGGGEGVASDAEDFFSEFRAEFKRLESALTQLRTNLSRTRYIIETADSYGEFKRIGKIFELPRFSRMMHSMEKALIDVADNADGKKTGLNTASFGLVQEMAVRLKEIELQKNFPLSAAMLREINSLVENFVDSSQVVQESEPIESAEIDNVETIDEELRRSSKESDEDRTVSLEISSVDAADVQVFRDEAAYTFETIQSAVKKLKASGSDADAIKDIQQSFRSLFTGSKLLHFNLLTGHFDLILKQLKSCIDSQNAIAPELLHLIEETLKHSNDLIHGEAVGESEWGTIKSRLEKFGTQKELPSGDTPLEFRAHPIKTADVVKAVESKIIAPVCDSVVASNENWIEAFQPILESHPFSVKETKEVIPDKPHEMVQEKSVRSQAPLTEIVKPEPLEAVAAPKIKTIEPEKEKTDEPDHVTIPTNLADLMAGGDVDLSDLELPSFVEKLNIEPQNIVSSKAKTGKKKKVAKKSGSTTVIGDRTHDAKMPDSKQFGVAVTANKNARFSLEESNFDSVDMEILDIFNQEASGYFKILDKSLAKLENQITDESALKDIERVSHSLKSSSRMLGLAKVSGLAGVIELIAERCNEKELEMNDELRTIMSSTVQSITLLLDRKPADVSTLIDYLLQLEAKLSAPNIFIGNIPGAPAIVSSGVFVVPQSAKKEDLPAVKAEPVVEKDQEKPVEQPSRQKNTAAVEPKMESTENYFTKIGVDEEIVEIFKEESATYFKLITNSLAALRENSANEAAMRDIEKSAHSLRSSAKMLGFQKIGNVVKPIESVAEHINEGALAVNDAILELFAQALVALKKLGEGMDVDITDVVDKLTQVEKMPAQVVTAKAEKRDSSQVFERIKTELGASPKEEKSMQKQSASSKKSKSTQKKSKSQSTYFADIQFTSDPILKQINKGAAELLEEMAQSPTQ